MKRDREEGDGIWREKESIDPPNYNRANKKRGAKWEDLGIISDQTACIIFIT